MIFLFCLSISLLFIEGCLRIQEPVFLFFRHHVNGSMALVDHPVWHHQCMPNACWGGGISKPPFNRFFDRGSPLKCSNQQGWLEDHDFIEKDPGVCRIFVLGDSFTEGYYKEDTVAGVLRGRLLMESGERVEVINVGTSSYSPIIHYLRIKHQLVRYQPNALIMNLDLTDVFDDAVRYANKVECDEQGEPVALGHGISRDYYSFLKTNSYFVRLLNKIYLFFRLEVFRPQSAREIVAAEEKIFVYHSSSDLTAEQSLHVQVFLSNIKRIIQLCNSLGIKLVITMYPHRQQLSPDEYGNLWHRKIEYAVSHLCNELGVLFFSAYDGILAAFMKDPEIYWPPPINDMHFTPEGQRIWANLVADFIVNIGMSRLCDN